MKSELIEKLVSGLTRAGVGCSVCENGWFVDCVVDGLPFVVWVVKNKFYEFSPKRLQSEWSVRGYHSHPESLYSKLPTPRFSVERSVESWVKQLPSRLDVVAVKEYHKEFKQSLDVVNATKAIKQQAVQTVVSTLSCVVSGLQLYESNNRERCGLYEHNGMKNGFSLSTEVGDYDTRLELSIPHGGKELKKVLEAIRDYCFEV